MDHSLGYIVIGTRDVDHQHCGRQPQRGITIYDTVVAVFSSRDAFDDLIDDVAIEFCVRLQLQHTIQARQSVDIEKQILEGRVVVCHRITSGSSAKSRAIVRRGQAWLRTRIRVELACAGYNQQEIRRVTALTRPKD